MEPEPVEPEPTEPDPVAFEPEPVPIEPEPDRIEPDPDRIEPDPDRIEPEPIVLPFIMPECDFIIAPFEPDIMPPLAMCMPIDIA